MRVLFCASYPNLGIGYAKIANTLSNHLAKNNEVYYMAMSNDGEDANITREIDPSITFIDVIAEEKERGISPTKYGQTLFIDILNQYNPDLIFLYNDIIVCHNLLTLLPFYNKRVKVYTYLDLVYKYERLDLLREVLYATDELFVFSDCWKQHVIDYAGYPADKIHILYHGMNKDTVRLVDKTQSRALLKLPTDGFIILNTNRNCYRKAYDITINAFIKLLKLTNYKKNIYLYINCVINVAHIGYDIIDTLQRSCKLHGVSYPELLQNKQVLWHGHNMKLSDENMVYLYNACDVGINTCVGEGFGLCNTEHGAMGIPQVVSNVGALADIFKDTNSTIKPVLTIEMCQLDYHSGYLEICDYNHFANKLLDIYNNQKTWRKKYKDISLRFRQKYNWDIILPELDPFFTPHLEDLYQRMLYARIQNANEYMPDVRQLSSHCKNAIITGISDVYIGYAILAGLNDTKKTDKKYNLTLVDIKKRESVPINTLIDAGNSCGIKTQFIEDDILDVKLSRKYDLYYLNTTPMYGHILKELIKMAPLIRKYIIIPYVVTYGTKSKPLKQDRDLNSIKHKTGLSITDISWGIIKAITQFIKLYNDWEIKKIYKHGDGLIVLERKLLI